MEFDRAQGYLIIWNRYVIFWIAAIFQHDCQMPCTCICIFVFVSKIEKEYCKKWCMNMDFSISCGILLGVSAHLRMLWPAVMYRLVLPLHQSCRKDNSKLWTTLSKIHLKHVFTPNFMVEAYLSSNLQAHPTMEFRYVNYSYRISEWKLYQNFLIISWISSPHSSVFKYRKRHRCHEHREARSPPQA